MTEKHNITLHAIFRDADVLRNTLRDYASCKGHRISFYRDQSDALSRIPITNHNHATLITARPESLSRDGKTALRGLISSNAVYFILWLDDRQAFFTLKPHLDKSNLYIAETISQFDTMLNSITSQPNTVCHPSKIQAAPLSEAELNALQGIKLL